MIIYLSLAVALAGVLMYGFCSSDKLQKIGFAAYCCGLGAFLLTGVNHLLTVVK